jgi:peptidoglycan-associated lipoprotein
MVWTRSGMAALALLALAACNTTGGGSASVSGGAGAGPSAAMLPKQDEGEWTTIGIADTVYFDYDKATLRPEAEPVLAGLAQWMRQHPQVKIRIAGHADERGTREYNLALGDRRAAAVRAYLAALAIPATRLDTVSYGKERPAVVGSTEEAWAKNRRAVPELE